MTIKELVDKCIKGIITSDISMQRDIVWNKEKQEKVIDSVLNDIPLPAIYLYKIRDDKDEVSEDKYEVLDGKQRIEAFRKFRNNEISYQNKTYYYWGQSKEGRDLQEKFENTELTIINVEGDDNLKRETFYRINALGVPLNNYEIINGLVNNTFLKELNQYAKDNKVLKVIYGEVNSRGKYQYEILKYLFNKNEPTELAKIIESQAHFIPDELNKIYNFINDFFIKQKKAILFTKQLLELTKEHKWYNLKLILLPHKIIINETIKKFHDENKKIKFTDKEKKTFIYELISAYQNNLELDTKRLFSKEDKAKLFNQEKFISQNDATLEVAKCKLCEHEFLLEDLEVDHIKAWSKGGRTELNNAQLLCKSCNIKKSNN
ncbi:HNH endonuclease family protein [Mycoplasma corogypsi]|uniref:HNH endonuclease family protein n=1 Tax=Mycoplasma corogypsi TaxID=2106 RepID=UPI003872E6E6